MSNKDINGTAQHAAASHRPVLNLSAGFNEAACVEYALSCGLKTKKMHEIFRQYALERTMPKLIGLPDNNVGRFNMDDSLRAARSHYFSDKHNEMQLYPQGVKRPSKKEVAYSILKAATESNASELDLKKMFKPKIYDNAVSYASVHGRDLFEKIVGQAASDKIILCDECMPPSAMQVVQTHFGQAWNIHMIDGKGVKDPALVQLMMDRGVDAVFTRDIRYKTPNDLAYSVMEAWHAPRITRNEQPPHIVTFSSEVKSIISQMKMFKTEITDYLNTDTPTIFLAIDNKNITEKMPPLSCEIPQGHIAYSSPSLS